MIDFDNNGTLPGLFILLKALACHCHKLLLEDFFFFCKRFSEYSGVHLENKRNRLSEHKTSHIWVTYWDIYFLSHQYKQNDVRPVTS